MRITLIFLVLFCVCGAANVFSQKNNVFLEVGGSGGLGSINFEKPLKSFQSDPGDIDPNGPPSDWCHITLRVGLTASPIDKNNGWVIATPVLTNFVLGEFQHKLELGAGLAPSVTTKGSFFIKSPVVIGYRYWPQYKHLFLRLSYTPLVSWLVDFQWQHWFGVSIGYRLGHQYE